MSKSKGKLNQTLGWMAFLASYLLVLLMTSMPLLERRAGEQRTITTEELAVLMTDGER